MSRPKGIKNKKTIMDHASIGSDGEFKTIKVSLKVLGEWFTAEGKTVLEAIQNLKPGVTRGVSILTIEIDGVKQERILNRFVTANLFGGGSTQRNELAIKLFLNTIKL